MAERNLIREGFVFNTRNSSGTVSGSQYVSPGQISGLVDEDLSTNTLTVSGGESVVLDADLGARWKLDRIELYTNDVSSSNFTISISDNNADFRLITMTGSAGLWVGDMDPSTVSGSPRYIRYEHTPTIDTEVYEWSAVNDEDLLDFGPSGDQTSLNIDDSPIGGSSTLVETLTIRNNFTKSAEGFVFVDRTDNDAEDEIEISLSPNGPWHGRNSLGINQPSLVAWEIGEFDNTRVVPSGLLTVSFEDGDDKGWSMSGATQTIVDGKLRGSTTSISPLVYFSSEYLELQLEQSVLGSQQLHDNKFALRAADVDTVRVVAQTPAPPNLSDFVEGPRLFWKTEQDVEATPATFRTELSTLSSVGSSPLKSIVTEYTFDVGTIPTWSGTIRGLGFQPFTAATGTGYLFDFHSIEVTTSLGEYISLEPNKVYGEEFAIRNEDVDSASSDSSRIVVSNKHVVQADCIITKVGALMPEQSQDNRHGVFLVRELPGSTFPAKGNNFDVVNGMTFPSQTTDVQGVFQEASVFWYAQAGDRLAAVVNNNTGILYVDGDVGASYGSPTISGLNDLTSLFRFETLINTNDFFLRDREYLIFYEAVSPESVGFPSAGTYRTPVFDVGLSPSLAMIDYDTNTPSDSSIDSLGEVGFDSIKARANDSPPSVGLGLGETGQVFNSTQTLGGLINRSYVFAGNQAGPFQINMPNEQGVLSDNVQFSNVALATTYHAVKDEIWVLNGIVSGTNPFQTTNVSPVWDVLDPEDGSWLRTDHIKGTKPYGYSSLFGNDPAAFIGVGFMADYTREEIYIVQRTPGFSLGAGNYFGVVTDLDGNFKDVLFRNTTLNTSQISSFITNDEDFFASVRGITYAEDLRDLSIPDDSFNGVFFVLFDDDDTGTFQEELTGNSIAAFRNGSTVSPRDNQIINWSSFSDIPGLGFTINPDYGVKGISYNNTDGRLYLLFDNLTGTSGPTNRKPELIALDISFDTNTSEFQFAAATVSGTAFGTGPVEEGFSRRFSLSDTQDNDDPTVIRRQTHDFTKGMAYNQNRDTFLILRSLMGNVGNAFPDFFTPASLHYYRDRTVSFLYECGAGSIKRNSTPAFPSRVDSLWGTVSGTLGFEDVASDGVNFPTGRFVQVEYQLHASSDQSETPYLTSSKIAQGLRIGQISAGGSKDIYLRTTIPDGKPITQQQGRLKVYWESLE